MKNLVSVFITILFFSFNSQGFGQGLVGLAPVDGPPSDCFNDYVILGGGDVTGSSANCLSLDNPTIVFDLHETWDGISKQVYGLVGDMRINPETSISENTMSFDLSSLLANPSVGESINLTIVIPGRPTVTCSFDIPVCN